MRNVFLLILFFGSGKLVGQERLVSKAISEINDNNFEKAERILNETATKINKSPLYQFAKFSFYYATGNYKFNIDSAHAYLIKSEATLNNVSDSEKEKYCKEYQLCLMSFKDLKNNVANTAYNVYSSFNSIDSLNKYKERFGSYSFLELADSKIDTLLFLKAEREQTIQAFEEYIRFTKKNLFSTKARANIQELYYSKVLTLNSVEGFEWFLSIYPEASNAEEVQKKIYTIAWEEAQSKNTADAYIKYKIKYPKSPHLENAWLMYKNKAVFVPYLKSNGRYIYVDYELMQQMIDQEFESAGLFENNFAIVKSNGKWGVINRAGVSIIPFKYDFLTYLKDLKNQWIALDGKMMGVIDSQNKNIISFNYHDITYSELGNTFITSFYHDSEVNKDFRTVSIINTNGENLFKKYYDNEKYNYQIINGRLILEQVLPRKSILLLNYSGKELFSLNNLELGSDHLTFLDDGMFRIGNIIFDKNGQRVDKFSNFEWIGGSFKDGRVLVKSKAKGSYVTIDGFQYYREPRMQDDRYGYADYNGNLIIPFNFEYAAEEFSNDITIVMKPSKGYSGNWDLIDKDGNKIGKGFILSRDTLSEYPLKPYNISKYKNGFLWITSRSRHDMTVINGTGMIKEISFDPRSNHMFLKSFGEVALVEKEIQELYLKKKIQMLKDDPSLGSIDRFTIDEAGVHADDETPNSPTSCCHLYGLINYNGELLLPVEYKSIVYIDGSSSWASFNNSTWRVLEYKTGKFISEEYPGLPKKVTTDGGVILWEVGVDTPNSSRKNLYYLNNNYKPFKSI